MAKTRNILNLVEKKGLVRRYIVFVIGLFITALAYNIFFLKTGLMLGGAGGIAIIFKDKIDPSLTILAISIIGLILGAIFLGKDFAINSFVGALLYPLFVKLTSDIVVSIPTDDMMLVAICGAVLIGIGNGLTAKTGFSSGGIDAIIHIFHRKKYISHGTLYALINGLIIIAGGFVLGYRVVLYAIVQLYIISLITDKVTLGISSNKTFFIVTDKIQDVKEYICEYLSRGVTIIDAKGGYSKEDQEVIMAVIPTVEYFKAKEGILEIDPDAFITICDSYQVYGEYSNKKHKKKKESDK
ncbi:MAG: YitT family protein [Bacilli bacterium]|nr:YitT family protein [Bacilli bacterium]